MDKASDSNSPGPRFESHSNPIFICIYMYVNQSCDIAMHAPKHVVGRQFHARIFFCPEMALHVIKFRQWDSHVLSMEVSWRISGHDMHCPIDHTWLRAMELRHFHWPYWLPSPLTTSMVWSSRSASLGSYYIAAQLYIINKANLAQLN